MTANARLRSLRGYPKSFRAPIRYEGKDLMLEDGDLVIDDGALAMIEGAPGVGQSMALALSAYFADLSDPVGFARIIKHRGAARPSISSGAISEFTEQALWERENSPDLRTTDPRGMSLDDRIAAAIEELGKYLEQVLDVRFDGHDLEVDYRAFGYETHVLRIDGLVPAPGVSYRASAPVPVRRASLLQVEDLTHRLVAHLKDAPELTRDIPWRTFERLVAELLEGSGWEVLELTRGHKDGGVDIYAALPGPLGATLAVIDCKKYAKKIGVEKVRSIAGLKLQHQADVAMLITTSYFTSGARDLERNELREHVALHDFDRVKEWLRGHRWRMNGTGLYLPASKFSADLAG